jgi:hypothetical protein
LRDHPVVRGRAGSEGAVDPGGCRVRENTAGVLPLRRPELALDADRRWQRPRPS